LAASISTALTDLRSAGDFASIALRMRLTVKISVVALLAAGIAIAQAPTGQAEGKSPAPGQSPASLPPPQTVTPQTYPAEQIQVGEGRFASQCGFCHGRDAAGGETGPDLTRSKLVAEDNRSDRIGAVVRAGRPDQGMPAFSVITISDADLSAMVAFIHDRKVKSESLGGGRRSVEAADLATGNADAGRSYFNGKGGCAGCHSATGDLKGVASKYQGLVLLQRMLYPAGQPAPARPKVTVSLPSGETVVAPLASEDEFTIVILDPAGARQTYQKTGVKFKIDDPMSAHFDLLGKYTDGDMHNVFAYLETMK
jgi:cytochrome c oxidase cbb3-type subunit 3